MHIRYFDNEKEAFYNGYKPFKESVIKEVADKYKKAIPKNVFEAIKNWEIEIGD